MAITGGDVQAHETTHREGGNDELLPANIAALSVPEAGDVNTTPGRSLDTPFQPNADRPTYVNYSVSFTLGPDEEANIRLLSDASSLPTTEIARIHAATSGGVTGSRDFPGTLTHHVPAGHFVLLETNDITGAASSQTIRAQTETTL